MSASEFESVISNQTQILSYIIVDGGLAKVNSDGTFNQTIDWFQVAEWGFNVGRQDCDVYLNILFRISREKQRNDSMLTAIGTAASAVLTATTHGQTALSVVAASFGMTSALNDALFQSYLFSEAPGLVAIKVKSMQDAFQDTIEKNQADGTSSNNISTAAAAFSAIQGYYNLCLPQTIDGTLLQAVASTSGKTVDPGKPASTSQPSTSKTPQVLLAPTATTTTPSVPSVVKVVMPTSSAGNISSTTTFGEDSNSVLIRNWLQPPNGAVNRDHLSTLKAFISAQTPPIRFVESFLSAQEYAAQRATFAKNNSIQP